MLTGRRSSHLSAEEVHALLAPGARERLATAPHTTSARALAETLAALANANGGWLLLSGSLPAGSGQASGLRGAVKVTPPPFDTAAAADLLLQAALLCDPPLILPAPQLLEGAVPGAPGLLLQVPPGLPNVYNVAGVYPTRLGAHNRPLTTPELRRLLLERGEGAYEAQAVEDATPADLDAARVERYLNRLMLLPADDATETLLARGCLAQTADGVRPTVAGLLLFGRTPQQFLRSAEILCVRYPGAQMADEFVRQEIGGPLTDQIRQAEAFVASNMSSRTRLDGMARNDRPAFLPAVVREAIVNAVAHRDYSVRGEGIRLLLFSDRLEVYSPGRLPGHVTLENLKDERFSRNEALVALLSDLGFIERLGYGIDRMFAALREAGLPDPIFEETAAGFRVTLRSGMVDDEAARPAAAAIATPAPPALTGALLNERQQRALVWVAGHGRITNSDLQEMAPEVSAETIRRDLADLVERNLLLRIGSKRATYYILK
jgi:ATP-dependent DNA helicase RecG